MRKNTQRLYLYFSLSLVYSLYNWFYIHINSSWGVYMRPSLIPTLFVHSNSRLCDMVRAKGSLIDFRAHYIRWRGTRAHGAGKGGDRDGGGRRLRGAVWGGLPVAAVRRVEEREFWGRRGFAVLLPTEYTFILYTYIHELVYERDVV